MTERDDTSKIPTLLNLKPEIVDQTMTFDTIVNDPVHFDQRSVRFVLPARQGFLNSNSKITLSCDALSGIGLNYYPINIGVHSLIKSSSLRIGTTEVSSVSDFAQYMSYKSLFIGQDRNYEREAYLTQRLMAHDFLYNAKSDTNASFYGISNKNNYNDTESDTLLTPNLQIPTEMQGENSPVYSVALADLFPFLAFRKLPLLAISDQVSITLEFTDQASLNRMCIDENDASGTAVVINRADCQLISDHIFYPNEIMEQLQNATGPGSLYEPFSYSDFRLNKRSLTKVQAETENIINIGGAGRIVSKVISGLFDDNATDKSMLNIYGPRAPSLSINNNTLLTTNLRYNNRYLYPVDRSNPALLYETLVQSEQNVAHCTRQEYDREGPLGGITTEDTFMGHAQNSATVGLDGQFFWNAYRLNRNEVIDSRGIEVEVKYGLVQNVTHTYRTWLEMVREGRLDKDTGSYNIDFR